MSSSKATMVSFKGGRAGLALALALAAAPFGRGSWLPLRAVMGRDERLGLGEGVGGLLVGVTARLAVLGAAGPGAPSASPSRFQRWTSPRPGTWKLPVAFS